jgi:hypothetical protein
MKLTILKFAIKIEVNDQVITLPELCLKDWEKFNDYFSNLMAVIVAENPNQSLTSAVLDMPLVKNMLGDMFNLFGIDYSTLTPSVLNALIIEHEGKEGALFKLHNSYPKLKGLKTLAPQKQGLSSELQSLMRRGFTLLKNSALMLIKKKVLGKS